jgi:hypothetical protein
MNCCLADPDPLKRKDKKGCIKATQTYVDDSWGCQSHNSAKKIADCKRENPPKIYVSWGGGSCQTAESKLKIKDCELAQLKTYTSDGKCISKDGETNDIFNHAQDATSDPVAAAIANAADDAAKTVPSPSTFKARLIQTGKGTYKFAKGFGPTLAVVDLGTAGAEAAKHPHLVDPRLGEAMRNAKTDDERIRIRGNAVMLAIAQKQDDMVVGLVAGSSCTVAAFVCAAGASYLHNEFTGPATDRAIADNYFNNIIPQYNVAGYTAARDDYLHRQGVERNKQIKKDNDFYTP